MEEIWKDIKGFEGEYLISNYGNVKSLDRRLAYRNQLRKGKILTPCPNSHGYLRVQLGNKKRYFIHRLVAEAFIDNEESKPCVNHIDCNPKNNYVDNLEWCTHKENMEYASKTGHLSEAQLKAAKIKKFHKKPIYSIDIKTGERTYYPSVQEARRQLGSAGDICACLKDNFYTYKGKKFYYAEPQL